MPGIVAGLCGRSPACAAEHRDPGREFARLARQLRRHPVSGVGVDSTGSPHEMIVTENMLANVIMYNDRRRLRRPGRDHAGRRGCESG